MSNIQPILTVHCEEQKGSFERKIYPLIFTPENLQKFWEKARRFPTLFSEEINNDFNKFCGLFLHKDGSGRYISDGLFWVIDDFVGVFYLTDICLPVEAQAHYSFFDGQHFGREELTKEMIKYVFQKYQMQRLRVEIPLFTSRNKYSFVFIEKLGFKKEGRLRKARLYRNVWFDVNIYGLLKNEVLK